MQKFYESTALDEWYLPENHFSFECILQLKLKALCLAQAVQKYSVHFHLQVVFAKYFLFVQFIFNCTFLLMILQPDSLKFCKNILVLLKTCFTIFHNAFFFMSQLLHIMLSNKKEIKILKLGEKIKWKTTLQYHCRSNFRNSQHNH